MKRSLLLAAVLALASCGQTGADGYEYAKGTMVRDTVTVSVVTYPSQAALRRAAADQGVRAEGADLMAFATISEVAPRCTIHIVDPAAVYRPEWIGHEFTHCIRGEWHK